MGVKKRFIAGASCPACQASDSLRWWEENLIEYVECVECDYTEQRLPRSVQQSPYANGSVIESAHIHNADTKGLHGKSTVIGIFKPE